MKKSWATSSALAQGPEPRGHQVANAFGSIPAATAAAGHVPAVLVGAGQEEDVLAALAVMAREHVPAVVV